MNIPTDMWLWLITMQLAVIILLLGRKRGMNMNQTTEQKYINKIRELEKRVEKLEQHANECICKGQVHVDDMGRYDPYTDSFVRGDKAE